MERKDLRELSKGELIDLLEGREPEDFPEVKESIDLHSLKAECMQYLLAVRNREGDDYLFKVKQYIFEEAMNSIYGKDIWAWIMARS